MQTNEVIFYMIGMCVVFLLLLLLSEPLKSLIKFTIRAVVGGASIYAVNLLLAQTSIYVGLNYLTVFVVGLLGLPGFVMLYLTNYFL